MRLYGKEQYYYFKLNLEFRLDPWVHPDRLFQISISWISIIRFALREDLDWNLGWHSE